MPHPRRSSLAIRSVAAVAYGGFFFVMTMAGRGRINVPGAKTAAGDWIVAVATVLFLWVLLGARERATACVCATLARGAARFSYSLYLAHKPFLVFMTALLAGDSRWQLDGPHFAVGLALLIAAISYSWLLGWGTEFHTDSVRRWVERKIA